MTKRDAGFTLIELLVVIVIMAILLAGVSDMFVGLLRGYKQQSKIAETNIESVVGLEMLRRDIESAGYGLPWSLSTAYNEAAAAPATTYDDATTNPPRAIINGDDIATAGFVNGSDYLVIKAVNVGRNDACSKWTLLYTNGTTTQWISALASDNFIDTDRVIVISPGSTDSNSRTLIAAAEQFDTATGFFSPDEVRIIYGVDPDTNLRFPFNRADYSVRTNVTIPSRCAPGTGVLVKSNINQSDGSLNTIPLLDCVADMQVSFRLDRNGDGVLADTTVLNDSGGTPLTAAQIRDQLKEVLVYILAHEGQRDSSYTHSVSTITVGLSAALGRNYALAANQMNYRWKLYTLVVRPVNLR